MRKMLWTILLGGLLVGSLAAAGCGGGGGDDGGDAGGDPQADLSGPEGCATGDEGEVLFTFEADGEIRSAAALNGDGRVHIATMNMLAYGVGCDGTQAWEFAFECTPPAGLACPHAFVSSPLVGDDGTVYLGDDTTVPNYLFALDDTGSLVWTYESWAGVGQMDSAPTVDTAGNVFVGTRGTTAAGRAGQLVGLTPEGAFVSGFPIEIGAVDGAIVGSGDTIFVGHSRSPEKLSRPLGHTVSAYGNDGTEKWSQTLSDPLGYPRSDYPLSSMALDGNGDLNVIAALVPEDGDETQVSLLVFDQDSGDEARITGLGGVGCTGDCSPVVWKMSMGERVIVPVGSGQLDAVNVLAKQAQPLVFGLPTLAKRDPESSERWYPTPVIGNDGYLYAVVAYSEATAGGPSMAIAKIAESGTIEAEYPFGVSSDVVSAPLQMGDGGAIYIGTTSGRLYAVQSGATGLDDASPWPAFRYDARNTGNPSR